MLSSMPGRSAVITSLTMLAVLGAILIACDHRSAALENLAPPQVTTLESFRLGLLNPLIESKPPAALPEGFSIRTIREIEPSSWNLKHGAITTIEWVLDGPDLGDYVGFTLFPTAEAASSAWDKGRPHLPDIFKVRSAGKIPVLPEANKNTRIFNCSITDWPRGFSATETLLGNVLIRTVTITDWTSDSANATGAVALVFSLKVILPYNVKFAPE